MTVSSTSSRVVFDGDGSNTGWPVSFAFATADLVVTYTDATGDDFVISASLYSVAFISPPGVGGQITYPLSGSPIALGTSLTIERIVSPTQPSSFGNQGAMWPAAIEKAFDRVTMIVQGFIDKTSRALSIAPTDGIALNPLPNKATRANSVLGFDANGQPVAVTLTSSLVAASNWLITNFLPMGSAAAARAALAALAAGDNIAFTGTNTHAGSEDFTTGTALVATQARGDNSTKAATTAYADRAAATRAVGATAVNFNSANSDNGIAIQLPTGFTRYRVERVVISNASHSLTTATCGLFTAASGAGVAIVAGATAVTVSATADATVNNMESLALASVVTSFTAATLYFRVQTAEGAAATGDVTIFYQPLP